MTGTNHNGSRVYKREQVVEIINSALSRVKSPDQLSREELTGQLTDLKNIIEDLRHQLRAAAPSDISSTHIPSATDELDAVVGTTEEATNTIMKACEEILAAVKGAEPTLQQVVEGHVVRIFEGCTFQDITGQRIKKVTDSLKYIDNKITTLLHTLQDRLVDLDSGTVHGRGEGKEEGLLNGPALPHRAASQNDIDALFDAFDSVKKEGA